MFAARAPWRGHRWFERMALFTRPARLAGAADRARLVTIPRCPLPHGYSFLKLCSGPLDFSVAEAAAAFATVAVNAAVAAAVVAAAVACAAVDAAASAAVAVAASIVVVAVSIAVRFITTAGTAL